MLHANFKSIRSAEIRWSCGISNEGSAFGTGSPGPGTILKSGTGIGTEIWKTRDPGLGPWLNIFLSATEI